MIAAKEPYNVLANVETIDIMDMINPHFYEVWLAEQSNVVCSGGRSSMKSSVLTLKLVSDFLEDDRGNVVVLRKVAKYLRTSVYEQISWAIYALGAERDFDFGTSPMKIRHKPTGTAFYFYGVDDPKKLKSAKIARGYVMALFYEELAEFSGVEDIDIVQDTFIREQLEAGREVRTYYAYNPPRNPFHWVNVWAKSKRNDGDYLLHHSTYLDDELGFLSEQMKRKIEKYAENDPDYYRYMYLGEVIGLGDTVYNAAQFKLIKEIPEGERLILIDIAMDTGHQVSATAFLAFGLTNKGNVVLLKTYYYNPENRAVKKAPSEFSEDMFNFIKDIGQEWGVPIDQKTIDSADGAMRNQYFKDYGERLHAVAKLSNVKMIDYVHDLLAQGRVYVLDNAGNEIFIEEHTRYQWDADSVKRGKPEVIKAHDHTVDAFKYYVMDNLHKLGLKA